MPLFGLVLAPPCWLLVATNGSGTSPLNFMSKFLA